MAGCVHCVHVHELACTCVARSLHAYDIDVHLRALNQSFVHMYRSLEYEIGIYVELRRHVLGTQISSSSEDMSEVEAASRGLDNSDRVPQTHNDSI